MNFKYFLLRLFAWLLVLSAIFAFSLYILVASVRAQGFPEAGCGWGAFSGYIAHEWGHTIGGYVVDGRAVRPFIPWGDKWDSHSSPRVALAGFVGQIIWSAANAGESDEFSRCTNAGNRMVGLGYAFRWWIRGSQDAGDLSGPRADSFSDAQRARVLAATLGTSVIIQAIQDSLAGDREFLSAR